MNIISWILFGALAGWIASLIAGTSSRQGCLTDILVGVVGAFLGGLIMELVTGAGVHFAFNIRSMAVAVLGAIVLLVITGATRRRSRR